MKVLSFFSGGGLGDYGLELSGMEITGQVEIDPYCFKILNLRWPHVYKWQDIRTLNGGQIIEKIGPVDLVSGGFPCQSFSVAGKRRGKEDDRNLWPEMLRLIREIGPKWVLAENVPGIIGFIFDDVLDDLENEGYETVSLLFPAHALGSPHRRDRVWIVANSVCLSQRTAYRERIRKDADKKQNNWKKIRDDFGNGGEIVADSESWTMRNDSSDKRKTHREKHTSFNSSISGRKKDMAVSDNQRLQKSGRKVAEGEEFSRFGGHWAVEPGMGRVAYGVSHRLDRLRMLGNGQVVQVSRWIGEKIMEFEYGSV